MTVGIVGLGLIGGSFAKAYAEAGETVLAFDADQSVLDFAVITFSIIALEIPIALIGYAALSVDRQTTLFTP